MRKVATAFATALFVSFTAHAGQGSLWVTIKEIAVYSNLQGGKSYWIKFNQPWGIASCPTSEAYASFTGAEAGAKEFMALAMMAKAEGREIQIWVVNCTYLQVEKVFIR